MESVGVAIYAADCLVLLNWGSEKQEIDDFSQSMRGEMREMSSNWFDAL